MRVDEALVPLEFLAYEDVEQALFSARTVHGISV